MSMKFAYVESKSRWAKKESQCNSEQFYRHIGAEYQMKDKYILFRFVPTMRCNYRCSYCFLPGSEKSKHGLCSTIHTPEEWSAQ